MPAFLIPTPPGFRYLPTVTSHGWSELPPFSIDERTFALSRIQPLRGGVVVRFTILPPNGSEALTITVEGLTALTPSQQDEIRAIVARCLSFEQDLADFYRVIRDMPEYQWIERSGAGRMLVSPTSWEDLAKTLLTTNTTWRMTKDMVSRLVTLGDAYAGGGHAFPTPEQVAALPPDALNAHVRAGYRGAYLHGLAEAVASGRLDPELWRDPAMPASDVYKQLKAIKGFGDYAAGATLRLLGRFDQLGLDSVCRTMFKQQWNNGVPATDKEIAQYYAPFGEWGGLAVWMDVIRDYLLRVAP